MTQTEEILIRRSGGSPLLSLEAVAGVLNRSVAGLRVSISGQGELSQRLRKARCRIGRRVYFRITGENGIAAIIDGQSDN